MQLWRTFAKHLSASTQASDTCRPCDPYAPYNLLRLDAGFVLRSIRRGHVSASFSSAGCDPGRRNSKFRECFRVYTGIHISFGSLSCHFSLMAPADGCSSNYGSPIHFDAFKSCRVVEARKTDLYADLACEKYPLQAWGFEQNAKSYGIYLGPLNCNIRWKNHF